MATYLSMVNQVLVRLREDEVASVSESTYSKLIGQYVKQATREVENATDWNALRTTIQLSTVSGSYAYSLTDAGTSYKILGVFEDSEDYCLRKAPSARHMTRWLLDNNQTYSKPDFYDINGVDSNGDPVLNVYPIPDAEYTVNVDLVVKTDFSVASPDAVETPVPDMPIVLRATMHAIEERGDDAGLSLQYLQDQYTKHLGDAVSFDRALNDDESVWEVV